MEGGGPESSATFNTGGEQQGADSGAGRFGQLAYAVAQRRYARVVAVGYFGYPAGIGCQEALILW